MGKNANIYKLKLHEDTLIGGMWILRVPGGWIYYTWDETTDAPSSSIFVPYCDDMQEGKYKIDLNETRED